MSGLATQFSRLRRLGHAHVRGRTSAQRVLLSSLTLALSVALAACGGDDGDGGDSGALERLEKAGVVKVGYSHEKPFSFLEGDELTGISAELLKAFFEEHDVELQGELVDFAGLIPGLTAKRYDIVGAGMYILPERCEAALFGPPEYQATTGFAVPAGNPMGITSYAELADSDAVYGTSAGGAEVEYAEVAGLPRSRIKEFPSYADAVAAVAAGQIDVAAQLTPSLRETLNALDSDKVEFVNLSEPAIDKRGNPAVGYGAAAFAKSDEDLRDAYAEWFESAREDGTYEEIMSKFGFTEADYAPADVTTEDLCNAS